MPTTLEPSETTSSGNIPKPFGYFLAGLAVGAVCVLLPFLCVLPLALNQAHTAELLQIQLTQKDAELAHMQQMQNHPPPPPFPGFNMPPPPPPNNTAYPRPPERPSERSPFDNY